MLVSNEEEIVYELRDHLLIISWCVTRFFLDLLNDFCEFVDLKRVVSEPILDGLVLIQECVDLWEELIHGLSVILHLLTM